MSGNWKIALLPGDGVGPEVVAAAVRMLDALETLAGVRFTFEEFRVGACAYLAEGDPLPAKVFDRLPEFDAILLGAMGLPAVRWPGGVEMTPQLDLRERLDLYCGLRPLYLYHAGDSPLRDRAAGSIDIMLVRESTEGLFSTRTQPLDRAAAAATDTLRITRAGAERICRAAFRQALGRRHHVTLVDKANVLPSMAFFRSIFDEISREFPAVRTERVYIDASTLYLLQRPASFDVIVTENIFGDSCRTWPPDWWAVWASRHPATSATAMRSSSLRTARRRI